MTESKPWNPEPLRGILARTYGHMADTARALPIMASREMRMKMLDHIEGLAIAAKSMEDTLSLMGEE